MGGCRCWSMDLGGLLCLVVFGGGIAGKKEGMKSSAAGTSVCVGCRACLMVGKQGC